MIELTFSQAVKEKFPDLKIGFIIVSNVENKEFDENLELKKKEIEEFIKNNYQNYKEIEIIKKYSEFYKKFEKTYPIEFQIKSILNGRGFPKVSCVVEAMFMAELKNCFLTAGHDLDKIEGNLFTDITVGSENYVNISGKEISLKKDDIITKDNSGIISSVLYGPDKRTMITKDTKNYLFFSYFPYGEEEEKIKNHFMDIVKFIKIFNGAVSFSDIAIA